MAKGAAEEAIEARDARGMFVADRHFVDDLPANQLDAVVLGEDAAWIICS